MIRSCAILSTVALMLAAAGPAQAHRELFTTEQKARLKAAERIELDVVALTADGGADASGIAAAAAGRLQALGYRVANEPGRPPDVTVKIKCEERKTWEGPVTSGGDADRMDAAARLWKGPACQITYRIDNQSSDWRHEIRGDAERNAADGPADGPAGGQALAQLAARLADDPFPFLLAGVWGQPDRLLAVLEQPSTPPDHRATIITLLGNMFAVEAIPALSRTLDEQDPELVQRAAVALGAIGNEACIPVLLDRLRHSDPRTRLAAIKGLGRLAPLHPNSPIVPALLAQLPHEPVATQTEIVRALGTTTDRRILEPLRALNRVVQDRTRSDSRPELKELRRALGQSLDQFDGVHTDE